MMQSNTHTQSIGSHLLDDIHVALVLPMRANRFFTFDTKQSQPGFAVGIQIVTLTEPQEPEKGLG